MGRDQMRSTCSIDRQSSWLNSWILVLLGHVDYKTVVSSRYYSVVYILGEMHTQCMLGLMRAVKVLGRFA